MFNRKTGSTAGPYELLTTRLQFLQTSITTVKNPLSGVASMEQIEQLLQLHRFKIFRGKGKGFLELNRLFDIVVFVISTSGQMTQKALACSF